jgi:periplasmic protein CpxP/Spy
MAGAMKANGFQPAAKRGLRMMVLGVLVAVAATVAMSAWARGPGGHHGGFGGHGMFMGSPERMGRGVDHMLDGLNATDAQRAQIKQIVQAAATDLKGQREASRTLRERGMQVFTAPNVDANAAEAVRQQMVIQHDQSSKRMLQAMVEISRVLTPEQRAKIGEHMKQRAQKMQERMQRMDRERPKQ